MRGLRLLICAAVFLWPGMAHADEIIMHNGDHIQGRVVSLDSGKLVFETDYAGEITVDWNQVSNLTTEEPLEIRLKDDQALKGKAVTSTEGTLTLKPESDPPAPPIQMSQVIKLHPPKPPPAWEWSGRVSAGASKNSGNTETESYDLDGELTLKKFPHKIKAYAEYHRETSKEEVTKDNGLASLNYNRFVSEKWYLFGNALGARDALKDLNFQGNIGGGLGYQFWDSKQKNLSISLGPNYVYERYSKKMRVFDNKDYREYLAAFWSVDFDIWIFEDILQGFHHNDGTVDVQDGENWQIRTRTGLRFPLKYGLFTSFQYNYDFVNVPADGKEQYDAAYIFKLGWGR
ncbi:MAG: DUF481 domain-containing protein [Desulfobacteraceae bacterium]